MLMFSGIEYPVKLCDIPKFEIQNGIRCTVYGYDPEEKNTYIYPLYRSPTTFEKNVNLLIITDGTQSHYILIKSIAALLRMRTEHKKSLNNCPRCFQCFSREHVLSNHLVICTKDQIQRTVMPDKKIRNFYNFQYRVPNTINVYAGN